MSQKLGIALIAISALVTSANLRAEETDKQDSSDVRIKIKEPADEMDLILPFLLTELVQKDLNLTDEQKEKIAGIEKDWKERIHKLGNDPNNLSQKEVSERNQHFDTERFLKEYPKEAAETRNKLDEILLPGQFNRVQAIKFQQIGFRVFETPEIIEALGITDEQKEIIKTIRQDYWKERKARNIKLAPFSWDKFRKVELDSFARYQSLDKKSCEKVFGILTSSQIDKFKIIIGKEVDISKLNEQYVDGLIAELNQNRIYHR